MPSNSVLLNKVESMEEKSIEALENLDLSAGEQEQLISRDLCNILNEPCNDSSLESSKNESPFSSLGDSASLMEKRRHSFMPTLDIKKRGSLFQKQEDFFKVEEGKPGWVCGVCQNFNYESVFLRRQEKMQ